MLHTTNQYKIFPVRSSEDIRPWSPFPQPQCTDPTISVQRQKISLGSAEPSSAWAVSYRLARRMLQFIPINGKTRLTIWIYLVISQHILDETGKTRLITCQTWLPKFRWFIQNKPYKCIYIYISTINHSYIGVFITHQLSVLWSQRSPGRRRGNPKALPAKNLTHKSGPTVKALKNSV